MIITNKVVLLLDLSIIEKYIKNTDVIQSNNIIAPRLSQLKFYLKILNILYLIEDTNVSITSNVVKRIINFMHIFNNVVLTSKIRFIKALPKSDIVVI